MNVTKQTTDLLKQIDELDLPKDKKQNLKDKLFEVIEASDERIRLVFEALEMRAIDELLTEENSDIEETVRHMTYINKKAHRRNDKLQAELKESYSRRDMMEFAEYVGRLYNLEGVHEWSEVDSDEDLKITANDVLNYYERDKRMDNLPGKDTNAIKGGKDGNSLNDILYG